MSGQLTKLEIAQAELLKTLDGHFADVKGHLAQNKTVSAEKAYQCFFENYDQFEENRQQHSLLFKPKYFENFESDTKSILEEKSDG